MLMVKTHILFRYNVNDSLIFDYEIIGNDLLLTSLDDINGEFTINLQYWILI